MSIGETRLQITQNIRGLRAHRMSIGETRQQITQKIRGLHTTNQLGYSIFVYYYLHWLTDTGEGVSL